MLTDTVRFVSVFYVVRVSFLSLLSISVFAQWTARTTLSKSAQPAKHHALVRLDEKYFIIEYDPKYRLASYVDYHLTADHLREGVVPRSNRFHADTSLLKLDILPVMPNDYRHSGYDRGHLAPSGDFRWSRAVNESTFVMSNVAPQKARLNRVAWRGLEEAVRRWACKEKDLHIETGPILGPHLSKTATGVTIPKKFFKVILDETPPRKMIGFVMSQNSSAYNEYKQDVVPIRKIEADTGIHFFSELKGPDRKRLEKTERLSDWHAGNCRIPAAADGKLATRPNLHAGSNQCSFGTLKSADIRGCCSHHGGVMGPKHYHACCDKLNRVLCNDGSPSPTCGC